MHKNFLRVASANIKTRVLNIEENKNELLKYIEFIRNSNIDITIFPELTLSGITGGDLIAHTEIIDKCENALYEILRETNSIDSVLFIGLPIKVNSGIINAIFALYRGEIKAIISKEDYSSDELRIFSEIDCNSTFYCKLSQKHHDIFSTNNLIQINDTKIQVCFENNLNSISQNSNILLVAGGNITNSYKLTNNKLKLQNISEQSNTALVYSGASNFESSSKGVYAPQKYIIENGILLDESKVFSNGLIYNDINIDSIKNNRKSNSKIISNIYIEEKKYNLKRDIDKYPYYPNKENWDTFMKNILEIQSEALVRRLHQLPDKKIFLGLSGGLDSTLGLIVSSLAFYKLDIDSKNIFTITMPGLGTSDRTKNNAINLAKVYNTTFKEISIKDSVLQHFKDIGHDENDFDLTFENAQARERTQVLMDLTNKFGGIVLGTGNMSEIALGWATYNGDHMSMYGINSGLPKTLLREVVRYVANSTSNELLKTTLLDIIDTPISPELLPTSSDGKISQITENNIGPYELHDFFTYHLVKNKSKLDNIKFMAKLAYKDKYTDSDIEKWFNKFIYRFFTQAFKRNVSPDAPQILDYSLDHRNGFVLPSDIDFNALLQEK